MRIKMQRKIKMQQGSRSCGPNSSTCVLVMDVGRLSFAISVRDVDFNICFWDKTTLREMQILHNFDIALKCSGWCWKGLSWKCIQLPIQQKTVNCGPPSKYLSICAIVNKCWLNNHSPSRARASTSGFNSHLIFSWKDLKENRSFDSECRLFSEAKSSRPAFQCDNYFLKFAQIHFSICTNTFGNLDNKSCNSGVCSVRKMQRAVLTKWNLIC